jgi:hypothetical protein
VKNGVWRLLRLIVEALLAAIMPAPALAAIAAAAPRLKRRVLEPPRRRKFQAAAW